MADRGAATMIPDAKLAKAQLEEWTDVWVFVESERGEAHPVAWELLGEGRRLADELGLALAGVVMGPPDAATRAIVGEAIAHGADRVYLIEDAALADYRNQPFTFGLVGLVRRYKPSILLLGATNLGRDLAGGVATVVGTGLTADCTELKIDPSSGCLAADRPTFGGSLLCTIQILDYRPQMATIRPRVMAAPEPDPGRAGEIVSHPLGLGEDEIATKVLDFVPDRSLEDARLSYADFIVSAGRGMGRPETLRLVDQLAAAIGAEVGATRPLVTGGWVPAGRQIGQTGKTVRPKLYIAAGISGAIQHRVGMESSDAILAINTDPDAPIFDFATHGVVADAAEILPALAEEFARRLDEAAGRAVAAPTEETT
jgi:electron transfer flavoprotein alpha subunit